MSAQQNLPDKDSASRTLSESLRMMASSLKSAGHHSCRAAMFYAAKRLDHLEREVQMAEGRCEHAKQQSLVDQEENRVLHARLRGAHVTKPGQVSVMGDEYSERQLIEFLREAARNAKEGTWGMWRAKEFDAAANAMERMYESYLEECPHEKEADRLRLQHGTF